MKLVWHVIAMVGLLATVAFAQDEPKRITKAEALSAIASSVQPDYPAVARQLKIEGAVELTVLVAENGSVKKVDIVSGNPVLTSPTAAAVKTWKFKPFIEDGKPIQVLAPVTVNFKL